MQALWILLYDDFDSPFSRYLFFGVFKRRQRQFPKGWRRFFGSKTTSYNKAIWWATITTFAGSVCSIF